MTRSGSNRSDSTEAGDMLAPACGRILEAGEEGEFLLISIFLRLWDPHVVMAPWDGEVVSIERHGGRHVPAFSAKAKGNAGVEVVFECGEGDFHLDLIAGFIVRRVVTGVETGEVVKKGDQVGRIRFGSRVELRLPLRRFEPCVVKGERVRAGETRVAVRRNGA